MGTINLLFRKRIIIMSTQKSLTTFFKPTGNSVETTTTKKTLEKEKEKGKGKQVENDDENKNEKKPRGKGKRVRSGSTETSLLDDNMTKRSKQSGSDGNGTLVMEQGWKKILDDESTKPYFKRLKETLVKKENAGKTIYPPKDMIFRAFDLCPWDNTRVVIIGQDPYHGPGQANGLAFSVQKGVKIPPSLRNMIKEAMSDVGIKKPVNGCLEPWAEQGVLLLNTVLTVEKASANAHKDLGWETFTDRVIRELNSRKSNLVFMLWGKPAQKKASFVDKKKHHVIMSSHPSPLAATKTNEPFITSKCFSRANKFLSSTGQEPINWELEK